MNNFKLILDYDKDLEVLHLSGGYSDSCEYDEVKSIRDVAECVTDYLKERC